MMTTPPGITGPLLADIPLAAFGIPPGPSLPAAPSDLDSDSDEENDSDSRHVEPNIRASVPSDDWKACLTDEDPPLLPGATLPPHAQPWMQTQSRQVSRMHSAGPYIVTALRNGTLVLFRTQLLDHQTKDATERTGLPPPRRPDSARRRASNRSISSISTLQASPTFAQPRKASATVSVSEVDASGSLPSIALGQDAESAAAAALEPRASMAASRDDLTRPSLECRPRTPVEHAMAQATEPMRSRTFHSVEPYASIRLAPRPYDVIDVHVASHPIEGFACIALTKDHLFVVSMIDGRLLQALPVRTGTNRRDDTPHSVRAKPLASAVALLRTGTDADVVFSVVLDDGLVLCLDRRLSLCSVTRLAFPCSPGAQAVARLSQDTIVAGILGVVYIYASQAIPSDDAQILPAIASLDLGSGDILQLEVCSTCVVARTSSALISLAWDGTSLIEASRTTCGSAVRVVLLPQGRLALVDEHTIRLSTDHAFTEHEAAAHFECIDAACALGDTDVCIAEATADGRRLRVLPLAPSPTRLGHPTSARTPFVSSVSDRTASKVTRTLLLDTRLVVGYNTGQLALRRYTDPVDKGALLATHVLRAPITSLHAFNFGSKAALRIAAGSAHGDVALFDDNLELLNRWSAFVSPVAEMAFLQDPRISRLNARLAAVSANCTTAFLPIDDVNVSILTLVGSKTPLDHLCIKGDDILVIYRSGLARVWDAATGELRRSINRHAALDLLQDGNEWWQLRRGTSKAHSANFQDYSDETVCVNVSETLDHVALQVSGPATKVSAADASLVASDILRLVLVAALTPSIDRAQDTIAMAWLTRLDTSASYYFGDGLIAQEIVPTPVTSTCHPLVRLRVESPSAAWSISAAITAYRLLLIISTLRGYLNFVSDVQQAARLLTACTVDALSEAALQAEASVCFAESEAAGHRSPAALLLLGLLLIKSWRLVDSRWSHECADAIRAVLCDTSAPAALQGVAVELVSRGWTLWQPLVNASDIIHALIGFSMDRTETSVLADLRVASRHALLQVAAANTPLFISALAFDVLHTKTADQRIATLRLVAFVVRKKPLLMLPALPRLVEATVRGLDPMSRTLRQAVQPTATLVLNELVKTYPSMAFHGGTQRLAVGTSDGAVVVYDVKTATRLYVLEAHHAAITAISFAPDGRRLVTVALADSHVAVWKVGQSLLGLLTPAGPPRQGSGGTGKPYKTYDFVHAEGDDLRMAAASTLHLVDWSWPAERTARLRIRSTVLSFSVD